MTTKLLKTVRSLILGCCILLTASWALATTANAANLTASVDRSTLAQDETFVLTLRIDSRAATGQPDLSLLSPYFDILGRSKSTQMRFINGNAQSSTQWDITLRPKISGRILIPPFEFDGASSAALQVFVGAPSAAGSGATEDYYTELDLQPAAVYADQQLKVSIRLYTAVRFSSLEAEPLQLDGADVVKLDEQQYQRVQNGRSFLVYELNYAVFPRASGTLLIPPQRFVARKDAARSLFDTRQGQRIQLSTPSRSVDVKPLPPQADPRLWLPATAISLSQTLSPPDGSYRVGEPITRTLNLQAEGVTADRLPQLDADVDSAGFKSYPEPPQRAQQTPASGLHVSHSQRIGLVPTRAGQLTLPAIKLTWWDTATDQPRSARIAAQTIDVLPPLVEHAPQPNLPLPPMATAKPVPAEPREPLAARSQDNWLLWSNLAWACLCLLLAGLWWRARQQPAPDQPLATDRAASALSGHEADAFRVLESACRQGDWQSIRNALTAWRHAASDQPISDAPLDRCCQQLDRSLYGQGSVESFDTQALLRAVRDYRQRPRGAVVKEAGLPPLYG